MFTKLAPYAKAIVAVVGAVITALVQAFPDSPDVARWCAFASTILTALAVYLVPNKDPEATHQDESVQPPSTPETWVG